MRNLRASLRTERLGGKQKMVRTESEDSLRIRGGKSEALNASGRRDDKPRKRRRDNLPLL